MAFLSWWARQMLSLIPERFARADPATIDAILAMPDDHDPGGAGGVMLSVRRQGTEQPIGRHEPGQAVLPHLLSQHPNLPLLLRLPAGRLLNRDISLPLAAESGYERVLQYEMDRLTPFAAEDVFWSARPWRRNKETGRLDLRLSLVPRAWLAAPLETLADAGGRLAALEVQGAGGGPAQHIAIAHEPGQARVRQRRRLIAAACLCAVLAIIAVIQPFVWQSYANTRLDARIAALQPSVKVVEALRRQISSSTAGGDTIEAARDHLGDPLATLTALTRVLPDDTFLTDVTLQNGVITLTGESKGAVRLIPLLSADPTFLAPAFSAPVTRIESNNSDLFSIRAQLASAVPAGGTEPSR